jgi:hypothetical protein
MREDPQPNKPANEKTFQGDNFVRKGGDFAAWQTMQVIQATVISLLILFHGSLA